MHKFKVGDKVVRKVSCGEDEYFLSKLGSAPYYIVTSICSSGGFIQVDGIFTRGDTHPWFAYNFELHQKPEEELPPVPRSVSYLKDDGRLKLEVYNTGSSVTLLLGLRKVSTLGYSLDPDSALQLAHDLRRMAMDIKRKEKANGI